MSYYFKFIKDRGVIKDVENINWCIYGKLYKSYLKY